MTGTITITKHHANVLAEVPKSDRGAKARAADCQRKAQVKYDMTPESVSIHFQQLKEMGLVDCTDFGFCIRTVEGDRALDPVGAVEHAAEGARG